jgi:hypothetical protein
VVNADANKQCISAAPNIRDKSAQHSQTFQTHTYTTGAPAVAAAVAAAGTSQASGSRSKSGTPLDRSCLHSEVPGVSTTEEETDGEEMDKDADLDASLRQFVIEDLSARRVRV